ncbi:MAG: 2-phosphosulfolactate phosphatase [Flavobacteriales bacterium]
MGTPRIEVCFSPISLPLHQDEHEVVVVVDVLRASSAICTAFQYGVERILPLETLQEASEYQRNGYVVGAERKGQVVEGYELGNSPFHYMKEELKGETVAMTTTNGTRAIRAVPFSKTLMIGSLINLSALCEQLAHMNKNTLVLCAAWQDRFNMEDAICAGAIASQLLLEKGFISHHDSSIASKYLYLSARSNYFGFLRSSSHRRRLKALNLNEDIKYCLTPDLTDVVPIHRNGGLEPVRKEA